MKYALGLIFGTGLLLPFALEGEAAFEGEVVRDAALLTGGEPGRGKVLASERGCSSCHTIPGVRGADGLVGPPLDRIASRVYVAGVLPNSPENLIRWLADPPAVDPLTAMPDLGLTDAEVRDVAAFLYTLR